MSTIRTWLNGEYRSYDTQSTWIDVLGVVYKHNGGVWKGVYADMGYVLTTKLFKTEQEARLWVEQELGYG